MKSNYPPGFLRCCKIFPNPHGRNKKPLAFKVWQRRNLEPIADRVELWIMAYSLGLDWLENRIPGFQVWIGENTGHDFTEDPPDLTAWQFKGANLAPMMPEHQPQGKSTPEEMEAHRRQMKLREKAQKEADEMRARFAGDKTSRGG